MGSISRGGILRRILAVTVAVGVAAAVFFLRRGGVLHGLPALVFALLLVVILPSASFLSRRLLLGGAIFLGWMPLLWWVKLPVPRVDRVGVTLAAISGVLALWVLWAPGVRIRARRLVPRVGLIDTMPFAAAGLATWTVWPLLGSSVGVRSLGLLMKTGYDHAAHLAMAFMARAGGAIVPMLGPAPNGSGWVWTEYPQHFHATVTALTELCSGPSLGDTATEVLRYGRSLGLVQVVIAALLAAGVAQLPRLRRNAMLAWPLGALLVAVFLFGPGSWGLSKAFPNFVLACATVGLAVLVAMPMSGQLKPLPVFALGGLIVATTHGWVLLAPLAVMACTLALFPLGRHLLPQTDGGWVRMIAVLAATVVASASVAKILATAGGAGALAAVNEVLPTGFTKLTFLLLTGGAATAVALAAYARRLDPESGTKGACLVAISATGFLLVGILGVYLYATVGQVSYYFDKLVIGVGLVSAAVLVAGVDLHVGNPPLIRGRVRRSAAILASILATLAALQVFGLAGVNFRAESDELIHSRVPAAERVLQAAELAESRPFGSTVYLAAMPGDTSLILAHQWQRALSVMWNYGSGPLFDNAGGKLSADRVAELVQPFLRVSPQRTAIVAPEILDSVRAAMPVELRSRVITWEDR
jgi:hypothetical protein